MLENAPPREQVEPSIRFSTGRWIVPRSSATASASGLSPPVLAACRRGETLTTPTRHGSPVDEVALIEQWVMYPRCLSRILSPHDEETGVTSRPPIRGEASP